MSVKSSRSDGRWDHMRESLWSCPSWGPFYLTPLQTDISSSLPRSVRLPGGVGGAGCVTHILAGDSTAAPGCDMGEGLAAAWEGLFEFQPFWSRSLVWSRSDCCMAGTGWGQPAPGSERGREVLTPKCHFWGTPCKTCWTVRILNPLRHFLPPPGHCSRRICQVS